MAIQQENRYSVGGVMMPRPFKIRRLGHFGFNVDNPQECLRFYRDLLGFKVSDHMDFKANPQRAELLKDVEDGNAYFMHHGGDHHSFVLFPRKAMDAMGRGSGHMGEGDVTINQITWQTGSLEEVVNGSHYFQENNVPIRRTGRDMPGSNWHTYVWDPDDHINELYYGIEQIGWLGRSKPRDMYYRGYQEAPTLPQISEETEVEQAVQREIDVFSGNRDVETLPAIYNVEGVLLPRPFKITKIGPVNLFVRDQEAALDFYTNQLGFVFTEESHYHGHRIIFLRNGSEHHSLGLLPKALREELGCSSHTSCMSFGVEVGSYQQLKNAVAFLKDQGVTFVDMPQELHPGIDYAAYARDPDGHLIQIYYYMEQLGWQGQPRPKEQRRQPNGDWPESLEPLSDTYVDQVFQGPLG
ncbi:MAG: VOC family protein [Chloroflexi bacterium]|nr:VOC family protein [Chloroflexota bacterium]MCI0858488.1 VOC family protein [Chloroflexota bacterium]